MQWQRSLADHRRRACCAQTIAIVCASAPLALQTYEFTPADRSLLVMPLFHVHGLMAGLLVSWACHSVLQNVGSSASHSAVRVHCLMAGSVGERKGCRTVSCCMSRMRCGCTRYTHGQAARVHGCEASASCQHHPTLPGSLRVAGAAGGRRSRHPACRRQVFSQHLLAGCRGARHDILYR